MSISLHRYGLTSIPHFFRPFLSRVYTLFHFPYPVTAWCTPNNSHSGTHLSRNVQNTVAHPLFFSTAYEMQISQVVSFNNLANWWGVHPPPARSQKGEPDYLLMSSFASNRFSNGWRKGFVASVAPLIAWVISLAAVGKSPVLDEIRASARWLIQ